MRGNDLGCVGGCNIDEIVHSTCSYTRFSQVTTSLSGGWVSSFFSLSSLKNVRFVLSLLETLDLLYYGGVSGLRRRVLGNLRSTGLRFWGVEAF